MHLAPSPSVASGKAEQPHHRGPHRRAVSFQDAQTEPVTPSFQRFSAEYSECIRLREWLDNRGTMMIVTLLFIHPCVTRNMLVLLRCRPYPYVDSVISLAADESITLLPTDPTDDMRPRMDIDSDIICGSPDHAPFLWIAVAGLLLWTFGPVVCGVAFLWRHRGRLHNTNMRKRVGFVYVGYRKPFFYWDAVLAMRRVLVLLIAQQATAQPRQQVLAWMAVAFVCLALQFAVWPFDRGNMDILNRSELRGLLVWLMSLFVMQYLVIATPTFQVTISLVMAVIGANLAHYFVLVAQICRFGLLQMGYKYTALTDRNKGIAHVMTGCVTGPLVSWFIHREEDKRRVSPKVFYDWDSAAFSADSPPAASEGWCHPSVDRSVHRVVTAMQLTSAAVREAIERLKLTHVPSDFHEFLWSHAFLVQSLRQKRVGTRSRTRDQVVVHLPKPDDSSATKLRDMNTADLSDAFLNQCSTKVSTRSEDGKTFSHVRVAPPGASHIDLRAAGSADVKGISLYDLQANLCYVVDELVSREQLYQATLRTSDDSDLEKADTEASTDNHHQQHTGGWRGLYEGFRKVKRTLIQKGSPPDAIPEVLASLAHSMGETLGDAADDVPISGALSPVSSTQSRLSDVHTGSLTPPCHLMRVDWHRLSSDEKDSVDVSTSAEAGYDECSGLPLPLGAADTNGLW